MAARYRALLLVPVLAALGCGDTWDRIGFGGAGTASGGASGGSIATAGTAATGPAPDAGTAPDPCDALDLLFVVENGPDNQLVLANLTANIALLADYLQGSDAAWTADFHVAFTPARDTGRPCGAPGDLSIDPSGGGPCATAGGGPFASETDGDGLADTLACLANLPEVPADTAPALAGAATRALGRPLPGDTVPDAACGAGFFRPQALHAVVLVTSTDDPGGGAGSPGAPADWHAALADLEAPETGSALALFALAPDPADPPGCAPPAANVLDWLARHEHAASSDWCLFADGPAQWVSNAAAEIDALCP